MGTSSIYLKLYMILGWFGHGKGKHLPWNQVWTRCSTRQAMEPCWRGIQMGNIPLHCLHKHPSLSLLRMHFFHILHQSWIILHKITNCVLNKKEGLYHCKQIECIPQKKVWLVLADQNVRWLLSELQKFHKRDCPDPLLAPRLRAASRPAALRYRHEAPRA